jgi:hypothetical protein
MNLSDRIAVAVSVGPDPLVTFSPNYIRNVVGSAQLGVENLSKHELHEL